jgi:hypothetical protein
MKNNKCECKNCKRMPKGRYCWSCGWCKGLPKGKKTVNSKDWEIYLFSLY